MFFHAHGLLSCFFVPIFKTRSRAWIWARRLMKENMIWKEKIAY